MALPNGLYGTFIEVAKRQELSVAVIGEAQNLTYFALRNAVDAFASAMAAHGIRPGQLIVVNFSRPDLYLIALFAASKVGVSIVLSSFADAARLVQKPDVRLADDRLPPAERAGAMVIDAGWFTPSPRAVPDGKTVEAHILFGTSGSTGDRKLVSIGEAALVRRMQSRRAYIGSTTRLFCTMGARTAVAIESQLAALLAGGSVVLLPVTRNVPHYFDLYGITTLMATPLILRDLLALGLPKRIFWGLRKLTIGGAAPTPELLADAAERICDDITIGYGNTEIGGIAHCHYAATDYRPGKVGRILDGIEVAIVDDGGVPVRTGDTGRIRLRRTAADTSAKYADLEGASHGQPADGWFVPGDQGSFDADGNLYLAGRDDDVINAGGNKFSLELIESEIQAALACRCAALRVEGSATRITLVVANATPHTATQIVAFVAKRFPRVDVDAIYAAADIVRTETGKTDRPTIARLLQTNDRSLSRVSPRG